MNRIRLCWDCGNPNHSRKDCDAEEKVKEAYKSYIRVRNNTNNKTADNSNSSRRSSNVNEKSSDRNATVGSTVIPNVVNISTQKGKRKTDARLATARTILDSGTSHSILTNKNLFQYLTNGQLGLRTVNNDSEPPQSRLGMPLFRSAISKSRARMQSTCLRRIST